jgi:hypothetical protein
MMSINDALHVAIRDDGHRIEWLNWPLGHQGSHIRLIEATRGTPEDRDRCLLLLMFRHDVRVSEACRLNSITHLAGCSPR